MRDRTLDNWENLMEKISPTPNVGEVCRMYWDGEWRYYEYLSYSKSNGKMWERVSQAEYDKYRLLVESNKGLSLKDFL